MNTKKNENVLNLQMLLLMLIIIKIISLSYVFVGIEFQVGLVNEKIKLLSHHTIEIGILIVLGVVYYIFKYEFILFNIVSIAVILECYKLGHEKYINFIVSATISICIYILLKITYRKISKKYTHLHMLFTIALAVNFIFLKESVDDKHKETINNYIYKEEKIKDENLNDNLKKCNQINIKKISKDYSTNCKLKIEGSLSDKRRNLIGPIYDESKILRGYTGINIENMVETKTNEFTNVSFILYLSEDSEKYIVKNNYCELVNDNFIIKNILTDQVECEANLIILKTKKIPNKLNNGVNFTVKDNSKYKYYGTFIKGDEDKEKIKIEISQNEYFEIITGPDNTELYVELYDSNNNLVFKENIQKYNKWTKVKLNNSFKEKKYLVVLNDNGDKWGQWIGIRK